MPKVDGEDVDPGGFEAGAHGEEVGIPARAPGGPGVEVAGEDQEWGVRMASPRIGQVPGQPLLPAPGIREGIEGHDLEIDAGFA